MSWSLQKTLPDGFPLKFQAKDHHKQDTGSKQRSVIQLTKISPEIAASLPYTCLAYVIIVTGHNSSFFLAFTRLRKCFNEFQIMRVLFRQYFSGCQFVYRLAIDNNMFCVLCMLKSKWTLVIGSVTNLGFVDLENSVLHLVWNSRCDNCQIMKHSGINPCETKTTLKRTQGLLRCDRTFHWSNL